MCPAASCWQTITLAGRLMAHPLNREEWNIAGWPLSNKHCFTWYDMNCGSEERRESTIVSHLKTDFLNFFFEPCNFLYDDKSSARTGGNLFCYTDTILIQCLCFFRNMKYNLKWIWHTRVPFSPLAPGKPWKPCDPCVWETQPLVISATLLKCYVSCLWSDMCTTY